MDIEAEIRDLKRRVGELEGGFGNLSQQMLGVHRDLLSFQQQVAQRFDKSQGQLALSDGRLGSVEREVRIVKGEVTGLKSDVAGLRKDLPKVVADTMRQVLREGRE